MTQKLELLERIRSEQQDLRCVREACDGLRHAHAELLSLATQAAEHRLEAQVGLDPLLNREVCIQLVRAPP